MEYCFEFNHGKNLKLLEERGIGFERIIRLINDGYMLDIIEHPNSRYPNQKICIVNVDGYCYIVPCVIDGSKVFLKTIIPSRKVTQKYLKRGTNHE